jgi:hypothetical protein
VHELLGFWHYFFSPIGQPWYSGGVWGNQLQWTIVWLPTLVILYRKKWECAEKGCPRFGHHQVGKTHHRTCLKHTTKDIHDKISDEHKRKYPELHKFLKEK